MQQSDDGAGSPARGRPPGPAPGPVAAWTPPRFFDAAAGLPPSPDALRWLAAARETAWADPVGRHGHAAHSRAVLAQAAARFAQVLACAPGEIWFAPNTDAALAAAVRAITAGSAGSPVLASPLERLSVLRTLDELEEGRPVRLLPVARDGRLEVDEQSLTSPAALLIVQAANREIGTVQPIDTIAALRSPVTPLLVDASAVRHADDIPAGWDALVLEPAMWGGPDGIAVLACRRPVPWRAAAPATARERFPGRTSAALAAAAAMTLPVGDLPAQEEQRVRRLVDRLAARLLAAVPDSTVLGSREHRIGHVLAVSLLYANAEQLVDGLAQRGFAVHSGSACTSDTRRPSHVLTAIGALTHGNLRISVPPGCAEHEAESLADAIAELVLQQRRESGLA